MSIEIEDSVLQKAFVVVVRASPLASGTRLASGDSTTNASTLDPPSRDLGGNLKFFNLKSKIEWPTPANIGKDANS